MHTYIPYTRIHAYTYKHTHTHTHTHIYIYIYTYICVYTIFCIRTKCEKLWYEVAATGLIHYSKKAGGKNIGSIKLKGSRLFALCCPITFFFNKKNKKKKKKKKKKKAKGKKQSRAFLLSNTLLYLLSPSTTSRLP